MKTLASLNDGVRFSYDGETFCTTSHRRDGFFEGMRPLRKCIRYTPGFKSEVWLDENIMVEGVSNAYRLY